MKKKDIRLYNVMFPIWFFFIWPTWLWLLILPVNFLIDSLVVYLSARAQGINDRRTLWKQSILPVWIIGFASDFLGAGLLYLVILVMDLLGVAVDASFLTFPGAVFFPIPGVILAGVLIYFLNKHFSFRRSNLPPETIRRLCLHLAIFTAPYTMMIPLYW